MDKKIKALLEEIEDWMMDNDYECGEAGSDIIEKIRDVLGSEDEER